MSRDNFKTDRYFNEYIEYQLKRIKDFSELKKEFEGKDLQRERKACLALAGFYKDLLSAKYSLGASSEELISIFEDYLDNIKICGLSSYDDTIDVLSLAILFGTSYDEIGPVVSEKYMDNLTEKLISSFKGEKLVSQESGLLYPEYYQPFYDYAVGEMTFERFSNYMKADWYETNKEKAWYNSHLSKNNTYVGYWCWLAAALMKIRGDKVEKMEYVPVDLI